MDELELQLWQSLKAGNRCARESIFEKHSPLAKRLARKYYYKRIAKSVEYLDYLHLAYSGLLEAIDRFRFEDGVQFSTFAGYRIRGSILNEVFKMTELSSIRSHAVRSRQSRARSIIEYQPNDLDDFQALSRLIVSVALGYQLDEIAEDAFLVKDEVPGPYASTVFDELKSNLTDAIAALPKRDRVIIQYHYFYQINLEDIADVLCISKGRVSQLHARALGNLRAAL